MMVQRIGPTYPATDQRRFLPNVSIFDPMDQPRNKVRSEDYARCLKES